MAPVSCSDAVPQASHSVGWAAPRVDSLVSVMPGLLREFNVPGVSISLISGARIEWSRGFGRSGPSGSAVTPETVFQAASLGKPVFAHLVDRVASRGTWTLHDPIRVWSPPGAYPPEFGVLSAEALLSHTSGLQYDAAQDRVTLDVRASQEWSYSGAGYVVLQRALEAASRRTLEELGRSLLFDPTGLSTMSYVMPEGEDVAVGHDRSGSPTRVASTEANAGSSLHSSAPDYARFLIFAAGLGDSIPESWVRLTQIRTTVRGDLDLHWGVGWALERDDDGNVTAFHWGSNPGFKSFALLDRARELGLVILTNGDNGLELTQRIVEILDPRPHRLFEFYMLHPDD